MQKTNFEIALKKLLKKEAGWVNHKLDSGKETYKGISRKNYPNWEGWKIIDTLKESMYFPENYTKKDVKKLNKLLDDNKELQELVSEFYKENYWDPMHANDFDFLIAEKLFTFAINSGGPKKGIKYLQEALNYLNRNEKEYRDLVVDGIYGPATKNAYNIIKKEHMIDILYEVIKCLQCKLYLSLMDKHKNYEEFRGWFRRIKD